MRLRKKLWQKILCGFLAVTMAAPAALGAPRYNKKKATVKVKQTELTKEIKATNTGKTKAAPSNDVTADDLLMAEEKVSDIRDAQIKKYQMLIDSTDDDSEEKADYIFRLAEIMAQKRRFHHFRAMEATFKADNAKNNAEKQKWTGQRNENLKQEKKWLLEAVKQYTSVANNPKWKNYKRMDSVLFFLAYMLTQAQMDGEARTVFKRLIKDYQGSKYIPDAYLAFAEYFFGKGDFDSALDFYNKVLEFKNSGVYGYAKYKTAWVYYNLGDQEKALGTLIDVVQEMKDKPKSKTLVRAARKDVVRVYAEIGQADKAYALFKKVGGDQSLEMMAQLGDLYMGNGKFNDAIKTYHELMKIDSKNKELCNWQFVVFRAQFALPGDTKRVDELENLVRVYKAAEAKKIDLPKAQLEECHDNAMNTASELARLWHTEAIDDQGNVRIADRLPFVYRLYKIYLDNFGTEEEASEMRLYAAELSWTRAEKETNPSQQRQLFAEAAEIYSAIARTPNAPQEIVKEAAYSAMQAWKNALAVDDRAGIDSKKDEKNRKELAIPDNQKKLMESFDLYVKYVKPPAPNVTYNDSDEDYVFMKFYKARIFYEYNHFADAIPVLEDIINSHRKSRYAPDAAIALLDSLNNGDRQDDIPKWVDKLQGMPEMLANAELKDNLSLLKEQSMRLSAEKKQKEGDFKACGLKYVELLKAFPEAKGITEILFNAAACFDDAKLLGAAIKMRQNLIKIAPDDPLAQKSRQFLGANFARVGYFQTAAEYFEEFAKKFGGEAEAMKSLGDATFFRRGLGQDDKAIANGDFFIKQYGKKKKSEAAAVSFGLAAVFEKRKRWDDLEKHLSQYLKTWGGAGGVDRVIIAHVKIADKLWRESCPIAGVNGACVSIERARASTAVVKKKRKRTKKQRLADMPKTCAADRAKISVIDRRPEKYKEAMAHYKIALKAFGGGNAVNSVPGKDEDEKNARISQMLYFAARAQFQMGEDLYEKYVEIKFPGGLDFREGKEKASIEKFFKWKEGKEKALLKARDQYAEVLKIKGAGASHWAIAAASRVGQMYQNIADALYSAEIPKPPSEIANDPDFVEAYADGYCEGLGKLAAPLDGVAINELATCLNESTARNWFNEWSQLCEAELSQLKPSDFPPAIELRAEPNFLPESSDFQDVVTDLRQ
ncbi:MAG: hypothetical protein IT370_14475 [Deltaproteobacteria bacterium]|nr:hypothetical protein [Deltaproteobacteria bacterium]